MPLPLYTNDAIDNWKRYGGDTNVVNSYVAATGSSDTLQTPHPNAQPPTTVPVGTPATPGEQRPSMTTAAGVKQGATAAPLSLDAQKQWIDQNKPAEVSATYQGPDPYSMHWGGALIGGSNTGIQDYGNWQAQRSQYNQAMQKWQSEYADWEARNKAQPPQQPAQPAQVAQPAQQPNWGTASTQQQNLGQSPTTQPVSPYAPPGQRSTAQPGTGPVQKPDKSLSKVNERYAGVL